MNTLITIKDLPPSCNILYKRTRKGNIYVNPKVTAFKELVKKLLPDDLEVTDKKLKVDIVFDGCRKNSDIDNLLKVLLDSLNKIVYKDDKQIFQMTVTKHLGKEKTTSIIISEYVSN